jgi:cell wall-associated NlpC family hydrolase
MLSAKRARHARPSHIARHARPSVVPARVAVATAAGGFLMPLAASSPASADPGQPTEVRVAGPAHPVEPGAAPVSVRLLSDGHYVHDGVVEIQIPEGNGWRTVGRANTGAYGIGRTSIHVSRDTHIRAYYPGSTTRSDDTSRSDDINVESFGQRVVDEASRHEGAPYQYGAAGPDAFDCSGFTQYVFARLGKSLPRTAAEQQSATQRIDRSAMRPGDLVFLDGAGHVGIYAGNGQMWDAPHSGDSVRLRSIYSSSYAVGRVAYNS